MMWYEDQGINSDVVLKCKMLVRRNIKGFAFPSKMSDAERQTVLEQVSGKAEKLGFSNTKDDDKNLSKVPNLIKKQGADGVFKSDDEGLGIIVNQKNHLTVFGKTMGGNIGKMISEVEKTVVSLEETFDVAYSEKLGFLTSEPQYVGSGISIDIIVTIPGIVKSGNLPQIQKRLNGLEWSIRPLISGNNIKKSGSVYIISNVVTLGIGEDRLYDRAIQIINEIIRIEKMCRDAIFKKSKIVVEDQYFRSYGTLKYCRRIELTEALEFLSWLRFGTGLVTDEDTGITLSVINLLTNSLCDEYLLRPGNKGVISEARAGFIRKTLEGER